MSSSTLQTSCVTLPKCGKKPSLSSDLFTPVRCPPTLDVNGLFVHFLSARAAAKQRKLRVETAFFRAKAPSFIIHDAPRTRRARADRRKLNREKMRAAGRRGEVGESETRSRGSFACFIMYGALHERSAKFAVEVACQGAAPARCPKERVKRHSNSPITL